MFQKDVEMYHQFSEKNCAKPSTNKKKSKCVKFQYTILTLVLLIILLSVSVAVMWITVQAKFDQVYEDLQIVSSIKEDIEYIEQLQYFQNKQVNEQKPAALSKYSYKYITVKRQFNTLSSLLYTVFHARSIDHNKNL